MSVVGQALAARRQALGLNRLGLATQVGISHGHLRDIETGRIGDPGVSVVHALAVALGVTVDDLLRDAPAAPSGPATLHRADAGRPGAEEA